MKIFVFVLKGVKPIKKNLMKFLQDKSVNHLFKYGSTLWRLFKVAKLIDNDKIIKYNTKYYIKIMSLRQWCRQKASSLTKNYSQVGNYLKQQLKNHPYKISLVLSSIFIILAIRRYHGKILYFPYYFNHNKNNPSHYGMQFTYIKLQTADKVQLLGWHMFNEKSKRTIVYFHENAGTLSDRLQFCLQFSRKASADILLVAYRGYSESQKAHISEQGLQQDSKAIMDKAIYLSKQKKQPLYVYGGSLGGAVAIYSSGLEEYRDFISGVILHNTFTSIRDVVKDKVPGILWYGLVNPLTFFVLTNEWKSINRIQNINKPILFIKSMRDNLVLPTLMDALISQCQRAGMTYQKVEIMHAGHNDAPIVSPQLFFGSIKKFMEEGVSEQKPDIKR